MSAEVRALRDGDLLAERPALTDVPLQLRLLATALEAGEYGDLASPDLVLRMGAVIRVSGRAPIVMCWGQTSTPAQTFMDLHAGAAELMSYKDPAR